MISFISLHLHYQLFYVCLPTIELHASNMVIIYLDHVESVDMFFMMYLQLLCM